MTSSPLDGITVLDFSHALAGPYCSMLMAAYGARVIKVESPDKGDIGRSWGPPFQGGDASYFLGLNSGKQSLAVDLKKPEGLAICRQLAARADILLENFRPGTMNRLGLDYARLAEANPRLIYVSDFRLWPNRAAPQRARDGPHYSGCVRTDEHYGHPRRRNRPHGAFGCRYNSRYVRHDRRAARARSAASDG